MKKSLSILMLILAINGQFIMNLLPYPLKIVALILTLLALFRVIHIVTGMRGT